MLLRRTPLYVQNEGKTQDGPSAKQATIPRVKNSTRDKNLQSTVKEKSNQVVNGRGGSRKDSGPSHVDNHTGTKSKITSTNVKVSNGKENSISNASVGMEKPNNFARRNADEDEVVLAFMRAMNDTLSTNFLNKLQGLADGRVALATTDDNDRRRAKELKLEMEALSKSTPMETSKTSTFSMNVMCWNCCGTAAKGFAVLI